MLKKILTSLGVGILCLASAAAVSAKDGARYKAYSGILNLAITSCGLYDDNTDYWDYYDCGGVAYAELIDFEGDGDEELLYIYGIPRTSSYKGQIYRYRYAVWGYKDGKAYQVVNAAIDPNDAIEFIKLSICPQDIGLIYLETFDESEWLSATYSYSTIRNGVWTEMANMRIGWYEKNYKTIQYYQLNGQTISEGYFWQLDTHYRKNARDITPEDFSGKAVNQLKERLKTMKDSVDIFVNGKALRMENPPILTNGYTLVPIRAVAEAMGCEVAWDPENRNVIVTKPGTTGVFSGNTLLVNDTEYVFDVAPVVQNNTTFVHVRAVEAFGATVEWNGADRAVLITY